MEVHPEPEFRIVLKPSEDKPSTQELKCLRLIDCKASDIPLVHLSRKIVETGCWVIDTLDYQEVTKIKHKLSSSSWGLEIENSQL